MTINEHAAHFAGRPVVEFVAAEFDPDTTVLPADPAEVAWRVSSDYEGGREEFDRRFQALLATDWAGEIRALVIGEWGESYDTTFPIDDVVAAAGTLVNLTALFVGEMTSEEQEISWIQSTDLTPLLDAYPALQVLRARGGQGLLLQPGRYPVLRELAFETGGLSAAVVTAVGECDFPALEHLELWLGTDEYGGDATVADLGPILSGARLPALTYLGLRDAEIADEVAAALAGAPVVARLRTLDLSLGMLSDDGATALLSGQPLTHLSRLDLHHHFVSTPMMTRLQQELEPAGVTVDLSGANRDRRGDRYIAVSE